MTDNSLGPQIRLSGVSTHNLKNIDVEMPWGKITAIVGVSGSGKSSLAHDTLFVEGQLRYLETLHQLRVWSSGRPVRPQVRSCSGLSPAVLVSQKTGNWPAGTRLADAMEITLHLRHLFSHAAIIRCPDCDRLVQSHDVEQVTRHVLDLSPGTRAWILAPFFRPMDADLLGEFLETGFTRLFSGDLEVDLEEVPNPLSLVSGDFSVVIDRVVSREDLREGTAGRIAGSVEQALRLSGGRVRIRTGNGHEDFSLQPRCGGCDRVFPAKTSGLFSRNSDSGGCAGCNGGGQDCTICGGTGYSSILSAYEVDGLDWVTWHARSVETVLEHCTALHRESGDPVLRILLEPVVRRLEFLRKLDQGHLNLDRPMGTLSRGQSQWVRLCAHLAGGLFGVTTILDEPGQGLGPAEKPRLRMVLEQLVQNRNTVVLVEHDPGLIRLCDHVIELGPGAGEQGGEVLYCGPMAGIEDCPQSRIAPWMKGDLKLPGSVERSPAGAFLQFPEIRVRNLVFDPVSLPWNRWTVLEGPIASGKTTFLNELAAPGRLTGPDRIRGRGFFPGGVRMADPSSVPKTPHSHVASLCGIWDALRRWYAGLPMSKVRGYDAGRFSTTRAHEGRCARCQGSGEILVDTGALSRIAAVCPVCGGSRFSPRTLEVTWRGYSIADILELTVRQAMPLFAHFPEIQSKISLLDEVGLGYLRLGQPSRSLSGGELRRLLLSKDLSVQAPCCFLLDEPLCGLHLSDTAQLVELFFRLVDRGHTLITTDHTGLLGSCADMRLELSPEVGGKITWKSFHALQQSFEEG